MAGNMVGRTFNGRYRITERIGIGGMAEVYRAQDNVLGRVVAVKVMLPQYAEDPDFTRRFRQEASAAANLQSPYIVNVYDWGQDEGTYYIVMEYVRGSDLKTAIQERGAISERKVAQIGSQVCQALSVAHHLDIIHRDIKPQNIMIQPDGNIKVMDFGIARAKNSMKAQTSSVLGTAHYISPEQAQGKELTAASDIYSLGIVMYEAVTGHLPFDGPDAVSVAMKQVKETPKPPSHWVPDIDPNLESIIMKAMEKDPNRRFSTALEMRQVLTDYLAGRLGNRFSEARTQQMNTAAAPAGAYVPAGAGTTKVMNAIKDDNQPASHKTDFRANSGKKQKMSGKKKALIAILLLLIAAAIGYAAWAMMNTHTVPDVTGQELNAAEQTLSSNGYSIGTVTEVYSTTVEKGKVVSTDPQAGTQADQGTRVNINVSKGTEQVNVPDVTGKSEAKAVAVLTAAGLTATAGDSQNSDTVAKGKIISTDPSANTLVDKGSEVTYVVSLGPSQVSVPDVTGQSQSSATSTLSNAGFEVYVTNDSSDTVSKGDVISQNPSGGSQADKGSTVTIVVSTGPDEVDVPNVTGMSVKSAASTLRAAGFKVSANSTSGTVTGYSPTSASKGNTIYLTVEESSSSSSSDSNNSSSSSSSSSSSKSSKSSK